jgi:hypothetical protein
MAAVPAYSHALFPLPLGNTRAKFIDPTRNLVPWDARILDAGPLALGC